MRNLKSRIGILAGAALLSACAETAQTTGKASEVTIPIGIVGTSPIIEIQVNGAPVTVHFDLGNADSVSLFPAFLDQIEKEQVGETGGRKSLYGPEDGKPIYKVDLVQIGDIAFTDFNVVEDFHDAEFQANFTETRGAYGFVGLGLFRNHKLVIDYQSEELTIIAPDVTDSKRTVQAKHAKRLRLILTMLNVASHAGQMDAPGLRLHPLKGKTAGRFAVDVDENFRVVFRFEGVHAVEVDYGDYH